MSDSNEVVETLSVLEKATVVAASSIDGHNPIVNAWSVAREPEAVAYRAQRNEAEKERIRRILMAS